MKRILIMILCIMLGLGMVMISWPMARAEEQKIILDGKSLLMSDKMEHVVRRNSKLAFRIRLNPVYPEIEWPQQSEIFVMNADGSGLRRLTFSNELTDNVGIKWIDDKTIAYERFYNKRKSDYFKINIETMKEEEISPQYYESIRE